MIILLLLENELDFSLLFWFENNFDWETESAPSVVGRIDRDIFIVQKGTLTTGSAAIVGTDVVLLFKLFNTTICYLIVLLTHIMYC